MFLIWDLVKGLSGEIFSLLGLVVAAEGEVEVDAVLEALVFEADEGDAGGFGAALGFEVFEEGGPVEAQADIGESALNGELRLFDLLFEEAFLLGEGAVGFDGGLDFAKGEEGEADIVFDGGPILLESGAGAGGEGSALIDRLGERGSDAVNEEIGIEGAAEIGVTGGGSGGQTEVGKEVLAGRLGILGGGEKAGAGRLEVGPPFQEAGRKSNRDAVGKEGEFGGGGHRGRGIATEEDLKISGGVVAVELSDAQAAFRVGDIVAGKLEVDSPKGVGLVASFDDSESGGEGTDVGLGERELLFGGDKIAPRLCGVGGERKAGVTEVGNRSGIVGPGGVIEVAEAAPEIGFPGGIEREVVGFGKGDRFSVALAVGGRGREGGKAGGPADDRAFAGGFEPVGGGLEALVFFERFDDDFGHARVAEFLKPAARNLFVLP